MKNKRRSAFVPRVIFGTVFVGVVPACAVMSCGGDDTTSGNSQTGAAGQPFSVAAVGFAGFQGVADIGFGGAAGNNRDASSDAKGGGGQGGILLGVAAGGFGVAAGGFGVAGGGFGGADAGQKSKDSGADSSG